MTSAVVIPCRNEAAHIGALLDALARQTVRSDKVVIVDEQSTDETVALVDAWKASHRGAAPFDLRVVAGPGRGPGPAMNAGIRATNAEVIIRFDGHSRPGPEYVRWSLAAVADPAVGVVGGVWHVHPGAPSQAARATLGGLARQYFRYGFWKCQMLRKDSRALYVRQVPPIMVLPWTVATLAWFVLGPGLLSGLTAAVYPALLLLGAMAIAATRRVSLPLALVALGIVHLIWSAGFWSAPFTRRR